jgi:hypothetical protein
MVPSLFFWLRWSFWDCGVLSNVLQVPPMILREVP